MAVHASGNVTWVDYPDTSTLISATKLENIEGMLDRIPRGVVARNRRTTSSAVSASTAPVSVSTVSAQVVAGRVYRIGSPLLMWAPSGAALTTYGLGVAALRLTTDGTTPTTSSTLAVQQHTGLPAGLGQGQPAAGACLIPYTATVGGTLSILLTIYRGAGSAGLYIAADPAYPIDLVIEDIGTDPGSSGSTY